MKTIQLTDEQWEALQQGESIQIDPPKKKWEIKGGDWYVSGWGKVFDSYTSTPSRNFGMERATKEQAERLLEELRLPNVIRALAREMEPYWKADWNNPDQKKYYLYFNHESKEWDINSNNCHERVGQVYMSEEVSGILKEALNKGELDHLIKGE